MSHEVDLYEPTEEELQGELKDYFGDGRVRSQLPTNELLTLRIRYRKLKALYGEMLGDYQNMLSREQAVDKANGQS